MQQCSPTTMQSPPSDANRLSRAIWCCINMVLMACFSGSLASREDISARISVIFSKVHQTSFILLVRLATPAIGRCRVVSVFSSDGWKDVPSSVMTYEEGCRQARLQVPHQSLQATEQRGFLWQTTCGCFQLCSSAARFCSFGFGRPLLTYTVSRMFCSKRQV